MSTSALIVASPIWYCHPNELACSAGHARRHHREGFHLDQRRIDGHLFVMCDTCKEPFLGVVYSRPSPIVHCYRITRAQYDFWMGTPDDELAVPLEEDHETQDLLHRLGYNPAYRRRKA